MRIQFAGPAGVVQHQHAAGRQSVEQQGHGRIACERVFPGGWTVDDDKVDALRIDACQRVPVMAFAFQLVGVQWRVQHLCVIRHAVRGQGAAGGGGEFGFVLQADNPAVAVQLAAAGEHHGRGAAAAFEDE